MPSYSINKVFDKLQQQLRLEANQLEVFAKYECQCEGWLKAKCLATFDNLKNHKHIYNLEREVEIKGQKIDLLLDLKDEKHWIELKHWCLKQKGQRFHPYDFGLEDEYKKFTALPVNDQAWVIVLFTPNPRLINRSEWSTTIHEFNQDYVPLQFQTLDSPKNYPDN